MISSSTMVSLLKVSASFASTNTGFSAGLIATSDFWVTICPDSMVDSKSMISISRSKKSSSPSNKILFNSPLTKTGFGASISLDSISVNLFFGSSDKTSFSTTTSGAVSISGFVSSTITGEGFDFSTELIN